MVFDNVLLGNILDDIDIDHSWLPLAHARSPSLARARPSAPSLSDVEGAQAVSPSRFCALFTYYMKVVTAGWGYPTAPTGRLYLTVPFIHPKLERRRIEYGVILYNPRGMVLYTGHVRSLAFNLHRGNFFVSSCFCLALKQSLF